VGKAVSARSDGKEKPGKRERRLERAEDAAAGLVLKAGTAVVVSEEGFLHGSVGVIKAIEGTLGRLHIKVSDGLVILAVS
jgi:hypothetical protein